MDNVTIVITNLSSIYLGDDTRVKLSNIDSTQIDCSQGPVFEAVRRHQV